MGEDHECQNPRDSSRPHPRSTWAAELPHLWAWAHLEWGWGSYKSWSTKDILGSWESGRSLTTESDWSSQGAGPIAKVTVSHLG